MADKIGDRSQAVISYIAQMGIVSREELKRFFTDNHISNFYYIMDNLTKKNLIKKNKQQINWDDRRKTTVYYLSENLFYQFFSTGYGTIENDAKTDGMAAHYIETCKVRDFLMSNLDDAYWISETAVRQRFTSNPVPDALIKYKDQLIAVEVERTLKSGYQRYKRVSEKYFSHYKFNKVLYFTVGENSDGIYRKLWNNFDIRRNHLLGVTNLEYFPTVKVLKKDFSFFDFIEPKFSNESLEVFYEQFKN